MRLRSAAEGKRTEFDYTGTRRYLITLTARRSRHVFDKKETVVALLDILREIASLHQFEVFAYCFVPERLVMIIQGKAVASNMKEFLGAFRQRTSGALEGDLGHPLWKKTYLERVLRKSEESRSVAFELFKLPVQLGLSVSPASYPYLGSFTDDIDTLLRPMKPKRQRGRGWRHKPAIHKRISRR